MKRLKCMHDMSMKLSKGQLKEICMQESDTIVVLPK